MPQGRPPPDAPPRCGFRRGRSGSQGGFSFIELVVVMGAMGMLMGLAIGYIGNIGQATFIAQAKAMLQETAYRCINASVGDRRAIFTLRQVRNDEGGVVLRVGAAVARPVLTHQFETIDFASEARIPVIQGKVEIVRGGGRIGNGAKFGAAGYLSFSPQSVFAMTEGIELDVWLRPTSGTRQMTIVEGLESYAVSLIQSGVGDGYDVQLRLKLRKANEEVRTAALDQTFQTKSAPLIADGRWVHLQVRYDGLEASIRVNGLEAYEADTKRRRPGGALGAAELEQVQRMAVPPSGLVGLTISSNTTPYHGLMDSFRLMGVFRSQDLERDLPGSLKVIYPALPLRIVFHNGTLDPDVHSGDQMIRIKDMRNLDEPPMRLTMGMYGTVTAVIEQPGQGGPDVRNARERAHDARGGQ